MSTRHFLWSKVPSAPGISQGQGSMTERRGCTNKLQAQEPEAKGHSSQKMIKSHNSPALLPAATLCQSLLCLPLGYINKENNTHFRLLEMLALSELCSRSYNILTGLEVGSVPQPPISTRPWALSPAPPKGIPPTRSLIPRAAEGPSSSWQVYTRQLAQTGQN